MAERGSRSRLDVNRGERPLKTAQTILFRGLVFWKSILKHRAAQKVGGWHACIILTCRLDTLIVATNYFVSTCVCLTNARKTLLFSRILLGSTQQDRFGLLLVSSLLQRILEQTLKQ